MAQDTYSGGVSNLPQEDRVNKLTDEKAGTKGQVLRTDPPPVHLMAGKQPGGEGARDRAIEASKPMNRGANFPNMANFQKMMDTVGQLPGDKGKGPLSKFGKALKTPGKVVGAFVEAAGVASLAGALSSGMRAVSNFSGATTGGRPESSNIASLPSSSPVTGNTIQAPAPVQSRSFAVPTASQGGVGLGFGPNLTNSGMGVAAIIVALQRMTDVFTTTVSAAASRPTVMPQGGSQFQFNR